MLLSIFESLIYENFIEAPSPICEFLTSVNGPILQFFSTTLLVTILVFSRIIAPLAIFTSTPIVTVLGLWIVTRSSSVYV